MNKSNTIRSFCASPNLCLFIYLFINTLFVYKYGSRQDHINPVLLTFSFLLVYIVFIFYFSKKKLSEGFYKYSYNILTAVYIIGTIYINMRVDKYALVPDRWSAMEAGIKALFSGKYPYSAIDHRNGRSSNLPTLIFIGTPFYYIMKDVGFLQTFCSALYFVLVHFAFKDSRKRFFATLLFIASISFMWEIWVKSDLMSNFIITLLSIFIIQIGFDKGKKWNVYATAILSSQLLLTRLVTIIPLNILLFKKFIESKFQKKVIFILISIVVIAINFWIVFRNVSSREEFKMHNPFELQNSQLPFSLSIICIALSIYFSFYVKNLNGLLNYTYIGLFLPAFLAMIWEIIRFGFHRAYFDSRIDVSYFNICMPFLIFYWTMQIHDEPKPEYSPTHL